MARILIVYSTVDGHTFKICGRLRELLEARGHRATLVAIHEADALNVEAFDVVVVGASIRYGRHRPAVSRFIKRNRQRLDAKPNAFFSVNIVARKPTRNTPETNPYLRRFLRQVAWRPMLLGVFAGRLDYPRYRWVDRTMIRLIMLMTRGPTDPKAVIEFTDWKQVEAFGQRIAALAESP
jgi:menaquinone-dependent protoporphyrinogen oxidase